MNNKITKVIWKEVALLMSGFGPMLSAINYYLIVICQENSNKYSAATIFSCKEVPSMSLGDYLYRITKYSDTSAAGLTIALIYLDKLVSRHNVLFTNFNIHRLFATAILVANKFSEDVFMNNKRFAELAGVSTRDLNDMERKFLILIDYRCYIKTSDFEVYTNIFDIDKRLHKNRNA
jgi:hypothetical protein